MRNFVSIFSITIFLLLVWQCNPMFEQPDDRKVVDVKIVRKDIQAEKENLAGDLRDCSDRLEREISAIDNQMEKASVKAKASLKDLRTKLTKEKRKVDRSLKELEESTSDSWKKISKKSDEVLTEARIEAHRIEERAEDLIN